jgi:hypothetical protein
MTVYNFSSKLIKELFRGMGGLSILHKQKQDAIAEISQAQVFLQKLKDEMNSTCLQMMNRNWKTPEEFRTQIATQNFESREQQIKQLEDLITEKKEFLETIAKQEETLKYLKNPVFSDHDCTNFWLQRNYEVYADYRIDIMGLEHSKVDFFAVSANKKIAFFILLELNRNAPESNVMKLYYYLKNSRQFWDFEHIVILQVFSPKYIVEKSGKSLALAREMSSFLGNELFTGVHSFGEKKVRISYMSSVFGETQYELFSVFWKLMIDEKQDEEERFALICDNLPTNANFLALCKKFIEREEAKNKETLPCFHALVEKKGSNDDIIAIFRFWCIEILQFFEHHFLRFHDFQQDEKQRHK